MSVISGLTGAVNGYSTVIKWEIQQTGDPELFISSSSKQGEVAACGPEDWTGYFIGKGHTPGCFAGDAISFIGNFGNGKGASGTGIVDSLEITVDVEAARPVEYLVRFSRNGALTLGDAVAADATTPTIYCPTSLAAYLTTQITDTRYYKVIFRCKNKKYVDSETAAGVMRVRGAMSGVWLIRAYLSDPSTLPTVKTSYQGKFYVEAAKYWTMNYCHVLKVGPLGVDHNSEENVGAEISGVFSGYSGTSEGTITDPDSVEKWPFA